LETNSAGDFTGELFLNDNKDIFDPFLDDEYGDIYYASNTDLLVNIMDYIVGNPDFDASNSTLSSGRQGGWYDGPYQQLTNDYEYDEDYYAAYAMTKLNIWDVMLLGGVRYEKVKSDYFAYNARDIRNAQLQQMYDTTSVNENDFLLPMIQAKYSPFNWLDVRYAYTHTLARPDYHRISPKFTITQNNVIYAGNPDLDPAKAFNHDLNITFHSNKLGLFSIGGFYKTIENFVYQAEYRIDAAYNAGIDSLSRYQVIRDGVAVVNPASDKSQVNRPLNNPFDATVKGFEIDFQHNFWYLPAPFNNLVFGINYARIYSEAKYPYYTIESIPGSRPPKFDLIDSVSTGRLIDQPNHVLNTYLGYDYKGFSARLSLLFQDNSARSNGGEYPENDSNTKEYLRLDFSAKQSLPYWNSEIFLDVSNLNNEKTSWIQKSTGGFQGIENYGLTANIGIRVRY
jgi:TonB-dependent receptor